MFLIILLSSITILVYSEDPAEVFINVDEDYFENNANIHIKPDSELSVECASSVIGSSGDVNYTWYLSPMPYTSQEDTRIKVANSTSTNYVVSADSSHTGYYMCFITTVEGYAVYTPVIHVVVEYFEIVTESASKTIEPNEKVSVLPCSNINAYPTPIVTWKKDGVDVSNINLNRNVMHVTGTVTDEGYNLKVNDLIILNFISEYSGTYTCDVMATGTLFKGQKATARSYTVKTAAGEKTMSDNTTKILFRDNGGVRNIGDAVTLRCGASGYPTPTYEWYDPNNAKLQTSDRFEVLETSMIVKSIKESDDDAEYKCEAISGNSKYRETITLYVADTPPEFNNSMDNSEYNIPGSTVKIDFGLKVGGRVVYLWNGGDLSKFPTAIDINMVTNVLTLKGIQKSGSGVFQLIVYNEAGMVTQFKTVIIRDALPAKVKHTTKPSDGITVINNTIHSVRGANFTLECEGSGNPTPADISIDVPATSNSANLVKINQDGKYIGRLLIDSVTESYSGNYNCCTYNVVSGTKHEKCVLITLAVEERVQVTQNSHDGDYTLVIGNQVYGTKGYAVDAQCKATGLPRPSINITRANSCGTVSTITKFNDIEIIQVSYATDTGCITDSFQCCGSNTIQGANYTDCYKEIVVSFVDQQKPNDVKIENLGKLASDDSSLVSETENLILNCSAASFPESQFIWSYKNTDSDSSTYNTLDSATFLVSTTKSKGFTYSVLRSFVIAGEYFMGTNYEFQCTAKNIFGESTNVKTIRITSAMAVSSPGMVYVSVGLFLFIAALVAIFVMYIFFIISSGKKKKSDLGIIGHVICKCCEPKEEAVVANPHFDYKLLSLEKIATNSFHVPLYSHPRLVNVEADNFNRTPVYRELEQMTLDQASAMNKYEPLY